MTTGWALTGEPAQRRGARSAGAPAAPPAEPGSRHGGSKGEAALTGRALGIPVLGNRRQLRPKVGVVWDGGALPRQALWGLQATRPRGHQPRVGGRRRGTPGRRRDQGGEQPPGDGGRLCGLGRPCPRAALAHPPAPTCPPAALTAARHGGGGRAPCSPTRATPGAFAARNTAPPPATERSSMGRHAPRGPVCARSTEHTPRDAR